MDGECFKEGLVSRDEQQPEHQAPRNLKSSIRLALYAGLTSLFMTLLYQAGDAFYALSLHDKVEQAETILIVTVLSLFVFDPFLHSIRALIQGAPAERAAQHRELEASRIRLFITSIIVFVAICDGLLHEYLGHNVSPRGMVGIVQLVSSLAAPSDSHLCMAPRSSPNATTRWGVWSNRRSGGRGIFLRLGSGLYCSL